LEVEAAFADEGVSRMPDLGPRPPSPLLDRPGPALSAVAAELEEVFPPLRDAACSGPPSPALVRSRAGGGRRVPLARLGLLGAVALGGLVAGAVLPKPAPAARPAAAAPVAPLVASPPIAPIPVSSAPAGWVAPPAPSPSPAAEPAPARKPPPKAKPAPRPRRAAAKATRAAACGARTTGRWCAYRAVLAADKRLRRAYDRAVRAGASYDELVEHRRDWARLRKRASRDPEMVIERYDEMSQALDRARRRARS
jgi:hypothetical protein